LTRSITDGSELDEPLPPHIQSPYYGAVIAAEAIGSSSDVQISEIEVDDDNVAGYAFYDKDGRLIRAVLLNLKVYASGQDEERSVTHIDLALEKNDESNLGSVKLKRLTIEYVAPPQHRK
jgi:hypothetical protein